MPTLALGDVLPGTRYRIARALGTGAVADVYEAIDGATGARCALKIITEARARDPEAEARMRREMDALAKIHHPGVPSLLDAGTSGGRVFFAMPLLEGETLRERLRRGPLRWDEAVRIVAAALDALGAAHAHGLVHGAVRPENVFLCGDGAVKVLDLGAATRRDGAWGKTTSREDPRYMAPEQIEGDEVDARADVYAAGVLLHEMIAGRPPFDGPDPVAVAKAHVGRAPPPLDPSVPRAVRVELEAALRKLPEARPASASELARALRAAIAREGSSGARSDGDGGAIAAREPVVAAASRVGPHSVATFGRVWLLRFVSVPTREELDAIVAAVRARRERLGAPVVYVGVVGANLPVPEGASRHALRDFGERVTPYVEAVHLVIEGDGFRSAIQRSVVTAIYAMRAGVAPMYIYRTVDHALAAVSRRIGVDAGALATALTSAAP